MAFDRDLAGKAVLEVRWSGDAWAAAGVGFRLLDGLVITSCRCLTSAGRRLPLPDPAGPPAAPLRLTLRDPRTGADAEGQVVAAEPCGDYALLGAPPDQGAAASFDALVAGLARLRLDLAPAGERPALVFTSERRWIDGTLADGSFTPRSPAQRLPPGANGAPIFGHDGRVVGLIGRADVRQPAASACLFADHLPAWALRRLQGA